MYRQGMEALSSNTFVTKICFVFADLVKNVDLEPVLCMI